VNRPQVVGKSAIPVNKKPAGREAKAGLVMPRFSRISNAPASWSTQIGAMQLSQK
jgi:hypothetical protein